MKALLYRKFASEKNELLAVAILFAASVALWFLIDEMLTSFITYITVCVFLLSRSISSGEKVGWDSYSRALPVSVCQRVGARYIFWTVILLAATLLYSGFECIVVLLNRVGVNGAIDQVAGKWFSSSFSVYILCFLTFMLASSFALPVSYAMKRSSVRSMIILLIFMPAAMSLVMFLIVDALVGYGNFISVLEMKESIILIFAAVMLIFAASFCFSVIFETRTQKEKLKAVKAAAAVLTVAAVAASGFAVGYLHECGAFKKTQASIWDLRDKLNEFTDTEPTTDIGEPITEEATRYDNSELRAAMLEITEKICGKTFADKKIHEAEKLLEEISFGEMINPEYDEFPPVEIRIYNHTGGDEKPNHPDRITITANVDPTLIVYPDAYDSYDDAEKKHAEILDLFRIGTTEEEALERIKELGLCPFEISEQLKGNVPLRTYSFEIDYYSEYKNAVKPTVSFSFDVIDGRISNVE